MTTQTTKDFDELRAKVDAELAKMVKPKCCAKCNIKNACPVEKAFALVLEGAYTERIGLRCDEFEEADE